VFVQICGLPGSGKTTLAAAVADAVPVVALRVVEVVCPDPAEHRRRVETRPADLPGFALPTWDDVRRAAREYEPRHDERLVVDSTRPVADLLPEVLAYLALAPGAESGTWCPTRRRRVGHHVPLSEGCPGCPGRARGPATPEMRRAPRRDGTSVRGS
jgi:hypothetical protein